MRETLSRRRFLARAGGVALGFGTGAHALSASSADSAKVTYGETEGYHWIVPYVASAQDTWRAAGVQLDTSLFPSGRVALDAMLAGKLDTCICTDTPFIYAAMRGLKPRLIAPFSSTSKGSQIAVRSDRIKKPADLSGKTVATLMGGGGHYFLTRFMTANGLAANSVKIINMQPNSMVIALARGDVDAICWDAITAKAAIDQGDGKVVLLEATESPKYFRQYCLMLGNDAFVKARPEACDQIVVALQAAVVFAGQNPARAAEILATRSKTPLPAAQTGMAEFDREIKFDDGLMNAVVAQSEWAIENKLAAAPAMPLKTMYRELFYLEGVRKAVPAGIDLKA